MIILGIGGAVIKTAMDELREIVQQKKIDVLIHCGASLFHDFQRNTEELESHSHPLDELLIDYKPNSSASRWVWNWIKTGESPENSITELCKQKHILVLLSAMLGTDFFQLYGYRDDWKLLASKCYDDFYSLCDLIGGDDFTFINMGSAVLMPEIFVKALAVVGIDSIKNFKAHVVDFLPNQYRPKTRVAKYGKYFQMEHRDFLRAWLNGEIKI